MSDGCDRGGSLRLTGGKVNNGKWCRLGLESVARRLVRRILVVTWLVDRGRGVEAAVCFETGRGDGRQDRARSQKTTAERVVERKATAAKKAVKRPAEGRGQDAPSTDAPPNLYVLASTHRAYQQQAEADKRGTSRGGC